jgi:hypothetical protein
MLLLLLTMMARAAAMVTTTATTEHIKYKFQMYTLRDVSYLTDY